MSKLDELSLSSLVLRYGSEALNSFLIVKISVLFLKHNFTLKNR